MRFYEAIMMTLAVIIFMTGLTFGIDRELARRDFVKAIEMQDFEKPIIGCIYQSNCDYYTDKLYDYE